MNEADAELARLREEVERLKLVAKHNGECADVLGKESVKHWEMYKATRAERDEAREKLREEMAWHAKADRELNDRRVKAGGEALENLALAREAAGYAESLSNMPCWCTTYSDCEPCKAKTFLAAHPELSK